MAKRTMLVLVAALAAGPAGGQTFEVASVRPSPPSLVPPLHAPVIGTRSRHPPGRFVVRNWTLRALIGHAYGLPASSWGVLRLRGEADEILERAFDIHAALPPGVESVSVAEERAMLRALLAERFKLRVHTEPRELPVYALRRTGERLGEHLRPIAVDCVSWRIERLAPPTDADGNEVCRPRAGFAREGGGFGYWMRDLGDMAYLVEQVQNFVERPVVDETGLIGSFSWDLTFTPVLAGVAPNVPLVYPYIHTAIEEQLGLALVPTKAQIDVVVIDAVSRPDPN